MNKLCCVLNTWVKCSECDWIMCHKCLPEGGVAWWEHIAHSKGCPLNEIPIPGLADYKRPDEPGVSIFVRRKKHETVHRRSKKS